MAGKGNPRIGGKIAESRARQTERTNPKNLPVLPQPGDRSVLPNDIISKQGEQWRLNQNTTVQGLLPEDSLLPRISTRPTTTPLPGGPVPDDSWIVRNRPRLQYGDRDLGALGFTPEGKRLRKEAPNRDYSNLYQDLIPVENTGIREYWGKGFQWMPKDWDQPSNAVNQSLVQPLQTPGAELVIRNDGKVYPVKNEGLQVYREGFIQPDVAAGVKVNGKTIARTNKQLTDAWGNPSQVIDRLPIQPMGGGLYRPKNQEPWDNSLKVYPEGTQGMIVNPKTGSFAAPYNTASFNAGRVMYRDQPTFSESQLLREINESPDNGVFLWNGKGMSLDDGRVDDRSGINPARRDARDYYREDQQAANRFMEQSRSQSTLPGETGQAGIGDAISFARANDRARQLATSEPTYRSQTYRTADRPLTSAEMQNYLSIDGPQQLEKSRDFLDRRDVQMIQQGGEIRLDPNANQVQFAPQNSSGYNDFNRQQAIERNKRRDAALQSERIAQTDRQYKGAIELGLRAENERPGILQQEMLPISGGALTATQRLVNLRDQPTVYPSTLGNYSNRLRSGLPFALSSPQTGNRIKIDPRSRLDRNFGRPDYDSLNATFERSDTLGPGNYNPTFADSNGEVNQSFARPIGENVILKPDARGILRAADRPVTTEDGLTLEFADKNRQEFLSRYGLPEDAYSFHNSAILPAEKQLTDAGIQDTSPKWGSLPSDIRNNISGMDGGFRLSLPDPNVMSPRSAKVAAYANSTMGRSATEGDPIFATDAMVARWIEKNPKSFNEEFEGSAFAVKKALAPGGVLASATPALAPFGGQGYQATPQGAALRSRTEARFDPVQGKEVRSHILESIGQTPGEVLAEHQRTANFTKNVLLDATIDAHNSGVRIYDDDGRPLAPNRDLLSSNPEHDWFDDDGNRHQSTIQEVYQIEDIKNGKAPRGGTYVDKYGKTQQKTMYDVLKEYHAVPAGDRPISSWESQLPEDLLRKGYAAGESKYRLREAQRTINAAYGGSFTDADGNYHPGIGDGSTNQIQLQQVFDKDGNVLSSTIADMDLRDILDFDQQARAAGLAREGYNVQSSWQADPRAEIKSEQLLQAMSKARRAQQLRESVEVAREGSGLERELPRPGDQGAGYEDLRKLGYELPDRQDQLAHWRSTNPQGREPSQYELDKRYARDTTAQNLLPSVVHGGRLKVDGVPSGDLEEFLAVPVEGVKWGFGKEVSPVAKGWTPDPTLAKGLPEYQQAIADIARYKEGRNEPYEEFKAGRIDRDTLLDLWSANEARRTSAIPIGGMNLSDEIGVGVRRSPEPSNPIAAARIQVEDFLGEMPDAQLPREGAWARSGIVGKMPESLTVQPRKWGEREYRPQFADRLDPINGEPRRQDARSSILRQIPGMDETSQRWDDRPVAEQVRQSPQRQGIPPQNPQAGIRINNGESIVNDAEAQRQAEAFAIAQSERRKTAEMIARYQQGFVQ